MFEKVRDSIAGRAGEAEIKRKGVLGGQGGGDTKYLCDCSVGDCPDCQGHWCLVAV